MSTATRETLAAVDGEQVANAPPVLGESAKKLIACNQKLQELGINSTIRLPRIVVIGDQSTGKSSLIEAISTIEVPKASDLCTKCPIAINLANSQNPEVPWKCTVYVEEKFSYNPNPRQKTITNARPLGPWTQEQEVQLTPIASTEDRRELIKLIEQAQRLVLDPMRDRSKPIESSSSTRKLETFSPNTIRLDIEAEGWVNLSFVDLPGVIARTGKDLPAYSVDLVKSLARLFAQDVNNVVLLTLPLNHDDNNSQAHGLIEQERALPRTIAVFTKPDLASAEQQNSRLMLHFDPDKSDEFGFGQHVVMLNGANDADSITEFEYFQGDPWKTLPFATREKLGVPNLVDRIRGILFRETSRTLPENLRSIIVRLQEIDEELLTIPAPPDPESIPWKLKDQLRTLSDDVKQLFAYGTASRNTLQKRMQFFAKQIAKYEPLLKYKTKSECKQLETAQAKLQEADDSPVTDIDDNEPNINDSSANNKSGTALRRYCFTLDEIRNLNSQVYRSGVAGEIDPEALDKMNRLSIKYWQGGLDIFYARIQNVIVEQIMKAIESDFGHQNHLPVYSRIRDIATNYVEKVFIDEKKILDHRCATEMATPFTLDHEIYKQSMRRILDKQTESRQEVRLMVAKAVQKSQHIGCKKPKALDLKSLTPDEYDQEMEMFAKTAAYYELASKRFVDSCCQDILTNLVPSFHQRMMSSISEGLGLNDMEDNKGSIAELMAENPERELHRKHLVKEMENLEAGRQYITNVLGAIDDTATEYFDTPMTDVLSTDSTVRLSSVPTSRKRSVAADAEKTPSPTKAARHTLSHRGRSTDVDGNE